MVGRQNADIADILHLRDVAMAATFWLLMGYDFGCMIASVTLFDSRGGFSDVELSDEDIAHFEVVRDIAMATILAFCIWGAHCCHLANTTELCICDGNAALCQITLTTCSFHCDYRYTYNHTHSLDVCFSANNGTR